MYNQSPISDAILLCTNVFFTPLEFLQLTADAPPPPSYKLQHTMQTLPFQIDSSLTLTPGSALCPIAWICLPLQLSLKTLCQAFPPYIFKLFSPCLDFDTLHWVSPPISFEFWHLYQAAPPHGCSSLSRLVSDTSAGRPSQMNPLRAVPPPLWAQYHTLGYCGTLPLLM